MSALRQQALGVINVCKTALAGRGKDRHPVDNETIAIAQAILAQAKSEVPNDGVLAAVSLKPPINYWTIVQSATETVVSSLPSDEAISLAKTIEAARKRAQKPLLGGS